MFNDQYSAKQRRIIEADASVPSLERTPEITNELKQLEDSTQLLNERIKMLTNRLSPVMRIVPNDIQGMKAEKDCPLCRTAFGSSIRENRERIEMALQQLDVILNALEI